jgi:hypothetical protein
LERGFGDWRADWTRHQRFTSNLAFLTLVLASMSSISLPYYVKWTGHANDPKRAVPFGGRHSTL